MKRRGFIGGIVAAIAALFGRSAIGSVPGGQGHLPPEGIVKPPPPPAPPWSAEVGVTMAWIANPEGKRFPVKCRNVGTLSTMHRVWFIVLGPMTWIESTLHLEIDKIRRRWNDMGFDEEARNVVVYPPGKSGNAIVRVEMVFDHHRWVEPPGVMFKHTDGPQP